MKKATKISILKSANVVPPILWCPWAIAPLSPMDNPALHKIHVKVASAASIVELPDADDMSRLPDLGQPVLLEVQKIKVHGQDSKVMFDKGSTAALMTHAFAERAGLKGEQVAYWLVVVGHESILRHTLLYTFFMMDNQGTRH